MSFIDDVIAAVGSSSELGTATKAVVTDFLGSNRGLLERMGADAVGEFLQVLHLQGAGQAWETLVAKMGEEDLLGVLKETGPELDEAVDRRGRLIADLEAFAEAAGTAALRIVGPMIVAAI